MKSHECDMAMAQENNHMGKIVETKWKSFMGKDTIALSLNEDLDGPYTVSNLIELLQAVKEKFGDKNILIHDEQNNLV